MSDLISPRLETRRFAHTVGLHQFDASGWQTHSVAAWSRFSEDYETTMLLRPDDVANGGLTVTLLNLKVHALPKNWQMP